MTEQEEIVRLRNMEREELGKISMGPWGISFDGRHKEIEMAISALEEIQQYRALGTVKELREAMEKQNAKKMKDRCPDCGTPIKRCYFNCPGCGRAIDWKQ